MTEFIKFFFTIIVVLQMTGCTLHSKYGESDELDIEQVTPTTATNKTPIIAGGNYLATLPPDPYLTQINAPLSPEFLTLYTQATKALEENKLDEAETLFLQLIPLNPLASGPFSQLALIYKHKNDSEKAQAYAELAIEKNIYNYPARIILGIIAREKGDFVEAEAQYLKIISLWEGYADAHLNLGILYELYMGKFDKAIEQYEKYILIVEQDKKVSAWINDLKRRSQNAAQ